MPRPRSTLALVLSLLAASALPCLAWSPRTRVAMIDDSIKLMPRSLRSALEGRREAVLRGALGPMVAEDGPEHRAPWSDGSLDRQVETEARALVSALKQPGSFDALAVGFGRLAHFVMDAGFPPGVGADGADSRYAHFSEFCEQRRPKFRLVFYGHDDAPIGEGGFGDFARAIMQRARDEDRELSRVYAAAGDPPAPSAFDDRSVPFAVGSLAYSRTVTDVVRAWIAAWRLAGGDLGRTPYLEPAGAPGRAGPGGP